MRAFLVVISLLCATGSAAAGALDDRLGRLEYDSRIQRADMDMMQRQQQLDAQDARDRDSRRREDDMLRDLQRGPGIAPPAPSGYLYR